jgi:tetratricopeptide (TPR) repeat protein
MLRDKTQRRIVPRWRPSGQAPDSSDFASLKRPAAKATQAEDLVGSAWRAFVDDRNIGTASEALSEALLARNADAARDASRYILQSASDAPPLLLRWARDCSDGAIPELAPAVDEVSKARALLKLSPKNAVVWADMARHYAIQGDRKRALKCMKSAVQLAPDHRWILRTASRFLVHQGDNVAAHSMLAAHPRSKGDPWLMAAELACAHVAGKAPKLWKIGNEALRYDRYAPAHVSELAIAIGMMELEAGNRKLARKLVQRGLIAPTENVLAQVLWAKESKHLGDGIAKLDSLVGANGDAFEAAYKLRIRKGDITEAMQACRNWIADEPFASRPKLEATFVASLLDDHATVVRLASEVLRTDGHLSGPIELNLMFSEISQGTIGRNDPARVLKSATRLRTLIDAGGPLAIHATANLALLSYRIGDGDAGQQLYQTAIDLARRIDGFDSAAIAATYAAREAILFGAAGASTRLDEAVELANRAESEACLFYTRKLRALAKAPERAAEILSPSATETYLRPMKILNIGKGAGGYVLTIGRA